MTPLKRSRRVHEIASATARGSAEFQFPGFEKVLILISLFYHDSVSRANARNKVSLENRIRELTILANGDDLIGRLILQDLPGAARP